MVGAMSPIGYGFIVQEPDGPVYLRDTGGGRMEICSADEYSKLKPYKSLMSTDGHAHTDSRRRWQTDVA